MNTLGVVGVGLAGAGAGFFAAMLTPHLQAEFEKQNSLKAQREIEREKERYSRELERERILLEAVRGCSNEFQVLYIDRQIKAEAKRAVAEVRRGLGQQATSAVGSIITFFGILAGAHLLAVMGHTIARGLHAIWAWIMSYFRPEEAVAEAMVAVAA